METTGQVRRTNDEPGRNHRQFPPDKYRRRDNNRRPVKNLRHPDGGDYIGETAVMSNSEVRIPVNSPVAPEND